MKTSPFASVLALLLYSHTVRAQVEPITRVSVNQVRIDAIVTDAKGNVIRNLQENDFQVFQDGKRQKPIHVQYVAGADLPTASSRDHELKAADVKRTIVILLDDANMSLATFFHSRQAVKHYLEQSMQVGDLVGVLRTTQASSYLNPLMSDPAAVRLSVDQMQYHLPAFGQTMSSAFWLLRSTLSALSRMPGRKSVVLFSDQMPMVTMSEAFDNYRRLADSAIRASVKIYGIDSRGLSTRKVNPSVSDGIEGITRQTPGASPARQQAIGALQSADSFPPPSDPKLRLGEYLDRPNTPPTPRQGDMDGLAFLSKETGGLMLEDNNDLGKQLQVSIQDQSGYYLIAWDPGEKAFNPLKGSFADFHNISVKLTRPGLNARAPRGFYGIDSSGRRAVQSPKAAMQEALLSPFQSGQFDMRMSSAFDLEENRGYIRSLVYIDGKDIKFAPHADSRRSDCYEMHLELLTLPQPIDATVETLGESQITSLEMCGTAYETIAHNGLAITMLHPVEQPGGYQMRLAVRNTGDSSKSAPVGSAHQLVDVPDWHTAPSIYGFSVHAERQESTVVRPRRASESEKNMTLAYRPALAGDPAVRRFISGETIQFEARIVNVLDAHAEVRIIRPNSATGVEVFTGKAETSHDGVVSGTCRLDRALLPGSYDLQLIVNGTTADGRPFSNTGEIDFNIQE